MHGVRTVEVGPDGRAVPFRQSVGPFAPGGHPLGLGSGEVGVEILDPPSDLLPVLWRALGRAFGRLCPLVGVAPALTRLSGPRGLPLLAEYRDLFLRRQQDPGAPGLSHAVEAVRHTPQPPDALPQLVALAEQGFGRLFGRGVQQRRDVLKGHAQLAVHEHPVEAGDVLGRVQPVPRGRAPRRADQPDLVPVVERPDSDAHQRGRGPNGHRGPLLVLHRSQCASRSPVTSRGIRCPCHGCTAPQRCPGRAGVQQS